MKTLIQILAVFSASLFLVASCSKEDVNVTDVENYVNKSVFYLERECNAGRMGCFEFIWPIAIEFADGTSQTYEDQDDLRTGIQSWKEANPNVEDRPNLSFPLDIMDEDGTVFTVLDGDELRAVVQECRRTYFQKNGHRGHPRNSCFTVDFPVSISFPIDGVVALNSKEELKTALRDWRESNAEASEFPSLVFPINITIKETGESQSVESKEDLQQIKEDCRG